MLLGEVTQIIRSEYYPSLSTGLLKSYPDNIYMHRRFLARSGLRPNRTLNAKLVNELFDFVAHVA